MTTRAEFIGVGPLWDGNYLPGLHPEYPPTFPRGSAMTQHLTVERLVRIVEGRMIYLVNNLSRKWSRKKCWSCGNIYSPDKARCCSFCGQPLEDRRFLMTARWHRELFPGLLEFAKRRIAHIGLIPPVFAFYRRNMLMALYHYDGGGLLLDIAAPLPGLTLLAMALRLSNTLAFLHQKGIVLRPFGAGNVVLMPDLSARLFDLDVERIADGPAALYRDPAQPVLRDTRHLARLMHGYCTPEDRDLEAFFRRAADGLFPGPIPFGEAVAQLLATRTVNDVDTSAVPSAAAYSDVGLRRASNEDTWAWRKVSDRAVLYVVADGMGSSGWGDVASRLAADTVLDVVTEGMQTNNVEAQALRELLERALQRANQVVLDRRQDKKVEMGSTMTALLVVDRRYAFIAHAGDSRAYLLRDHAIKRLTEDHTVAATLVADGQITPEEAKNHRSAHILTSTIGGEEEIEIDLHQLQCRAGDRLLLCSDGLWNEVPDEDLCRILDTWADRQKAVREMIRASYQAGGHDNVTVLVLDLV